MLQIAFRFSDWNGFNDEVGTQFTFNRKVSGVDSPIGPGNSEFPLPRTAFWRATFGWMPRLARLTLALETSAFAQVLELQLPAVEDLQAENRSNRTSNIVKHAKMHISKIILKENRRFKPRQDAKAP